MPVRTEPQVHNIAAWRIYTRLSMQTKGAMPAMNYMFHILLCGVFLLLTVALYIYRHWLENHGDHYIHLHNDQHDSTIINSQATLCKRCETVDKLKYGALVATILYAVAIGAMAAYEAWHRPIL
jgi:hypothetical protein